NSAAIVLIFDRHKALHRMLSFLSFDFVVYEVQNLAAMLCEKFTAQGQNSGRKVVLDSLAGRAEFFIGILRNSGLPLPTALGEHNPALRADCRFGRFAAIHVGVMNFFLDQTILPVLAGVVT